MDAYSQTFFSSAQRTAAKQFLKTVEAGRTEQGTGPYKHWVTPDGRFWIEYDPPKSVGRYMLFRQTLEA